MNRRLLQTTTNSTNDTNTTNNSNYTNNTNNINDTSNMSTKNEFYSYNLYFYPNDDLNSDINSNILMNSQYTESTLKNWILNNITGIPNILNISQPIEIDRTPPIVNTSYITINATMNNINLNNVTIGQTGFLYLAIEPIKGNLSFFFNNLTNNETLFKLLPNNTRNQSLISYLNEYYLKNLSYITCPQIRNSFTSELLTNVFPAKRFIFNSSYDVLENISFTGLTNGTFYMISMYATGEDPSYFAPNSQIYKWIQNTTAIQRLALIGGKMVLVVVMWVGMIFLILMA